MQLIATRVYHDWNPRTGEGYELRDRMFRKPCGLFALMKAGDLPGDPVIEQICSLEEVFDWLQDCLEQITRAVIHINEGTSHPCRYISLLHRVQISAHD
jgi:hypothetical protein